MSLGNNIKNFTAADIEKYHKGLLSQKERHDLEKAALDDPFLADALEGYGTEGIIMAADLDDLKKRLQERTGTTVVPIKKTGGTFFPFLRVAVMIILLAGAGYLVYQFGFNKKQDAIALHKEGSAETEKITDSSLQNLNTERNESDTIAAKDMSAKEIKNDPTGEEVRKGNQSTSTDAIVMDDKIASGKASGEKDNISTPANPVPKVVTANTEKEQKNEVVKKDNIKALDEDAESRAFAPATTDKTKQNNPAGVNKSVAENRKASESNKYRNQSYNIFRGRVTDSRNAGIPFANVTNTEDNAGTYTDANGYFNLTHPDSVINIQVRSIGFVNDTVQIRNNITSNNVVMQEDRSLAEKVISNRQTNATTRSRDNNRTLEEPEPADGWYNYDTYLTNNLKVPDGIRMRPQPNAIVEVSFEVDKNGEPTDIRIEKSLCTECDKEAIRLIKDGPNWRRTAKKKGRTTVTINF